MRRFADSLWKPAAVLALLLTSACGKDSELPNDVAGTVMGAKLDSGLSAPGSSSDSADTIKAAIPKILLGLEEIKQEIRGLQLSAITPTKAVTPVATTPASRASASPARSTPARSTAAKTTGDSPAAPAAETPDATDELKQMLTEISSKPYIVASAEKSEKSLKDGHVTSGKMNLYTKAPNLVKVEVTYASNGASGAKVIYTSGEGTKAKVRPGGSLSFITTELAKTDDRLTSTNEYKLDDIDIFGLVNRLKTGYTAELVGKTQLSGTNLYILKVKATGTNSLDSRIAYEYLGYEPDSHKLRLWELYSADSKDPFFRMTLTKLEYPSSLPDSTFKL